MLLAVFVVWQDVEEQQDGESYQVLSQLLQLRPARLLLLRLAPPQHD